MKSKVIATVAILTCAAACIGASLTNTLFHKKADSRITGDYIETRTASVFAGPCHYNGELVTTGRDAIMAWRFDGGTYQGVDLTGLRVMAAVTSDESLGNLQAPRNSELAVDSSATPAQAAAIANLLKAECGAELGQITALRQVPITFTHGDSGYRVQAPGFASMTVSYRTDNSCCVQPSLVWFEPLAPISHRKVGYTEVAEFTGNVADHWSRQDEDSAFYGPIAF